MIKFGLTQKKNGKAKKKIAKISEKLHLLQKPMEMHINRYDTKKSCFNRCFVCRPVIPIKDLISPLVAQFPKSITEKIAQNCLEDVLASTVVHGSSIKIKAKSSLLIKLRLTKNTRLVEGQKVVILSDDEDIEVLHPEHEVLYEKNSERYVIYAQVKNRSKYQIQYNNGDVFGQVKRK